MSNENEIILRRSRSDKMVQKTLDVIENQFTDLFTIKETDDDW